MLSAFPTMILLPHPNQSLPALSRNAREATYLLSAHWADRGQPAWYFLDIQALHPVCLVSKRFRDVAQPILFFDFVIEHGGS